MNREIVVCQDGACDGPWSFIRADNDCLCSCGQEYRKHPYCKQSEFDGGYGRPCYILHVLCDGLHVKL